MAGRPDTLFLACTRPALVMGIPQDAFAVLVVVCGETWVLSQRPFVAGPLALFFYGVCKALSAYDPHIFRALFLWLRTWLRASINGDRWGGASVSTTPVRGARRAREIVVHA
jgi:type IV secretion system protein VirB3